MQPWAEALVKQHRENLRINDPNLRCLPHAPPRMWSNFVMQKIIQTQDSLTILDEYITYRQIFLDGRALPKDPEPMFKGYSVGRWEGDTLVVETIAIKDNWFGIEGYPLTDQARTIERIRRVNYGNLEVEVTVDDPKAYMKPWTRTVKLLLVLNMGPVGIHLQRKRKGPADNRRYQGEVVGVGITQMTDVRPTHKP